MDENIEDFILPWDSIKLKHCPPRLIKHVCCWGFEPIKSNCECNCQCIDCRESRLEDIESDDDFDIKCICDCEYDKLELQELYDYPLEDFPSIKPTREELERKYHDVIQTARTYAVRNRLCLECFTPLKPIGSARSNGKSHDDWDKRQLHKKCWIKLMKSFNIK